MGWCRNLVALVAMSLASTPLRADPSSDAFDTFRTELAARVVALSGELTPAEAKEKAALDRIAAALAAPSSGLADDVKMAQRVAKLVRKSALRDSPLVPRFLEALGGLVADYGELLAALRARAAELPAGRLRDKADAALDKLSDKLEAAGGKTAPATLSAALRGIEKDSGRAQDKVERAESHSPVEPCEVGDGTFVASYVGILPWTAPHVTATIAVNAAGTPYAVSLVARLYPDDPFSPTFEVSVPRGVVGEHVIDDLDPSGGVANDLGLFDGTSYRASAGTMKIDLIDPVRRRVKGSFEFSAYNSSSGDANDTRSYSGTFDVVCVRVVRP